jgi:hypothetical protein
LFTGVAVMSITIFLFPPAASLSRGLVEGSIQLDDLLQPLSGEVA